jgi:outer membrane protein OmpA-like peptidoglycan-associated protein
MHVSRYRFARLLGAGILTLACASAVQADDYTNHVGIMLGGGAYKLTGGDLDHASIGPWAQTGLRFGFRRHVDLEGTFRYGYNWDDTKNFRATTSGLDLGALYSFKPDAKFTPQIFVGTGVFWWNVDDFRGQASPGLFDSGRGASGFRDDGNAAHLNASNWKIYGGLGAEYYLMPRLSIRGLARLDFLIEQHIDNTGASDSLGAHNDPTGAALAKARANVDANIYVPAFAVSLTYWFGERDSDQDGIPNRLDKCMYEAEDKDKFQDEDGCPDPDNDGDGILDVQDKCPDEAEDKDGFQDEDGCPDLDNDNDGVPDAVDKCVDQAEDKDGFQDEDGCPEFDNDGDAVPDSVDTCPDTPPGSRVDEKGCPVSAQESQLLDTGMIRLQNVQFETGKAILLPSSTAVLDEALVTLKKYPQLAIEVGGHTDSRGSAEKNRQLSELRAQTVLEYLKVKDPSLDTSKYTAKGYGATVPIADNKTDEGRAANRRVELKVMNPEALQKPKE